MCVCVCTRQCKREKKLHGNWVLLVGMGMRISSIRVLIMTLLHYRVQMRKAADIVISADAGRLFDSGTLKYLAPGARRKIKGGK